MGRYTALVFEQLEGGPQIALFTAPAIDIAEWAGIPQRRRLGSPDSLTETAGFQREEQRRRVQELTRFMQEPRNAIQNPLLAAVQDDSNIAVSPIGTTDDVYEISISVPDIENMALIDLAQRLRKELIDRLPELALRPPPPDSVQKLRDLLAVGPPEQQAKPSDEESNTEAPDEYAEEAYPSVSEDPSLALLEDETRVVDFYDELNARVHVLEELGSSANGMDSIAGFDREFLESMVRPAVLVDGQHRLRGALKAIEEKEDTPEGRARLAELVDSTQSAEEARRQFAREIGRRLPVAMLLSSDPAEHVFQFVVVNQKATPMSNALLGTIVSTSLTQEELEPITVRLQDAGIELEGSRAVAYLTRADNSPFKGLVATGMSGDKPNTLPWSVMRKLVSMVQQLEGARPYHLSNVDWARKWREDYLSQTGLIPESIPPEERMEHWSRFDGPWRDVFIKLHTHIRDMFGDPSDMEAYNAWGSTKSNIFNMVSLSILTSDFFGFAWENGRSFGDLEDVDAALVDWIGDLNPQYFNRDWRMGGTKKDQPRIREAWSQTWYEYRIMRDKLPRVERYNPGGRT